MIKIEKVKLKIEKVKDIRIDKANNTISKADDVYNIVKDLLENEDRQNILCLCLDVKNRINNISTICIGSLNQSILHPREVFKIAIMSNSASIIIATNHVSGNIMIEKSEIKTMERISEVGELLGIEVLDFVVIGENGYTSYEALEKNK
ncbi:JAB domain-containing protein [Clostridium baratii]|uniref:DNA repair protein RadC n=1 Tax=Clostridium baratii TaxID=1561 RepID=A0A174VP24_9CLOT|nr:JAB domain-containing protein [Clostridium baratii]CUQ35216.1 DNA repair protein RadC [Clostridium baratii]